MIRVTDNLDELGIKYRIRTYDPNCDLMGGVIPTSLRENEYDAVAKTLICKAGTDRLCLILSYTRKADLKAVASAIRCSRISLASKEEVLALTGFQVGAVSPIATARSIHAVVDQELCRFPEVFVNAGAPGKQLAICCSDLLKATKATVVSFSL